MKTKKKQTFFKPSVPQPIKNLSWSQAKARFPRLNPFGDADKDRVRNFRDCKPFDIKRQGKEHEDENEFLDDPRTEDEKEEGRFWGKQESQDAQELYDEYGASE